MLPIGGPAEMYLAGFSIREVASEHGVSSTSVFRWLRPLGIVRDQSAAAKASGCVARAAEGFARLRREGRLTAILSASKQGVPLERWTGCRHAESRRVMRSKEWRVWRESVFARDDYTCVTCGDRGVYLEPHHIKPRRTHQHLIFDVSNGVTLCKRCHDRTKWREELFDTLFTTFIAVIGAE